MTQHSCGAGPGFSYRSRLEHVNDSTPRARLDLLRFLERVQERDLARTRRWIADEERRQAEHARGVANRPPEPDWLIERGFGDQPATHVHAASCWCAQGDRLRGVTEDQARRALAEGYRRARSVGRT
ncbi:DUF6233 domain-containing protein [Streptomyces sp. KL116D]|uniref:DUF6233 domain-containing protein n=1 Tax=Streptomyces sp. KL116D TaxID=3045152 RepID=UPI0035564893